MTEKAKPPTPPYATFASFMNFINKLHDTQIPARIDKSVFGNASGSLIYSIIASLKSLSLIDEEGNPREAFVQFVKADEEERKAQLAAILESGYPPLFSDAIDLKTASAGQFDDIIRDAYDAKGSTVDKVATFFIAAAKYADLEISPHLAARKPTASSASSGKSRRQRKVEKNNSDDPPPPPPPKITEKALEYRLVDLMTDAVDEPEVMQAIITVVTFLKTKAVKEKAVDE